MSFNIKTLIVCDTNSLRRVNQSNKKVDYSSFAFGSRFRKIKKFIEDNNLSDYVYLAVPTIVIEELINQMQREYRKEISSFADILARLQQMPNIAEQKLTIAGEGFNYSEFIRAEAEKFIAESGVILIEYKEEDAPSMLRNMLEKVIDQENVKSPFRPKDAGLKDGIIWETLMHTDLVNEFDKVIFLTRDTDYQDNCITDFNVKKLKHIDILPSEDLVIAELQKDYGNYIEYRKVYEYASKDYFKDYLFDLMKNMTFVEHEGKSLTIENYEVTEYSSSVNDFLDDAGGSVGVELNSKIVIDATSDGQKVKVPVSAKTRFIDIDYMEIDETTFEPNIN